jgi:hypothetical protein
MFALAATGHPRLAVFGGLVAFGFLLGVIGHIVRSRTMVMTGILVVGVVSAYWLKDYFNYTV